MNHHLTHFGSEKGVMGCDYGNGAYRCWLCWGAVSCVEADVTLNLGYGTLYNDQGHEYLRAGQTMALFVRTEGDNLFDPALFSTFTDQWSAHPDIHLIDRWAYDPDFDARHPQPFGLSPVRVRLNNFGLGEEGVTTNDPLMLAWYDTDYDELANGPGYGVNFGLYRTDTIEPSSDIPWVVPGDGTTWSLNLVTKEFNPQFGIDNHFGYAKYQTQVIPEPVSMVLAALGMSVMMVRRRAWKSSPSTYVE
jgi:hypothetical protein